MSATNLRNYTSTVAVDRSVSTIEHNLVRSGAKHISKTYDNEGHIDGISFLIEVNGRPLVFRLPSKWQRVFELMMQDVRRPRGNTADRIKDQALRTAWKILCDWVDVQTTMIRMDQVEPVEVFLAYLYDGKADRTYFEMLKDGGFKMLTMGEDRPNAKKG